MAIKTAPPTEKFKLGLAAGPNLKGMNLKRRVMAPGKMIMPPKEKKKKPGTDIVHVPFRPGSSGPADAGIKPNPPFKMISSKQHAPRLAAALALEARKPMLALEGPSARPALAGKAPMKELANPKRKAVEQKFTAFGELGPGKAEPKISKEAPRHGSSRAAGIKPDLGSTPPPAAEPKKPTAGTGTKGKSEGPKASTGTGPGSTRGSGSSGGQAPRASAGGDKASHLSLFNLKGNESYSDFNKRYRRLANRYHPDANVGKPQAELEANLEKMKKINQAYEYLRDGSNHKWAD